MRVKSLLSLLFALSARLLSLTTTLYYLWIPSSKIMRFLCKLLSDLFSKASVYFLKLYCHLAPYLNISVLPYGVASVFVGLFLLSFMSKCNQTCSYWQREMWWSDTDYPYKVEDGLYRLSSHHWEVSFMGVTERCLRSATPERAHHSCFSNRPLFKSVQLFIEFIKS